MRIAIIDLGTNTCNLLIAEVKNSTYTILHQSKQLVKMGDKKLKKNIISPEATKRTISSFLAHKKIIDQYGTDHVRVIATSGVRSALNQDSFVSEISEHSGWTVDVVSGEKEADLIFKGVLLAFGEQKDPALILDIGGGSNECILTFDNKLIWKESQATGMARIINDFSVSNPVKQEEILSLQSHFLQAHKDAFHMCKQHSVEKLIGCSGAFDTIADMVDKVDPGEKQRTRQNISIKDFYEIYYTLIKSTRDQRLKMKGMDMVRVDLIVPAVILIEQIVSVAGINIIIQTDFALREGVLYECINTI